MRKKQTMLLLAVLCLPTLVLARAVVDGDSVDVAAFFMGIQGNYTIEVAGGQKPDAKDALGDVTYDADQSVIRLPYCQPHGACFLGYNMFPMANTKVFRKTTGETQTFTLYVTDSGTTNRYEWQTGPLGKVVFRNYQFQLSENQTITLEHVLSKAAE